MIEHQVAALAAAGVTNIVLAVNYRPEIMTAALQKVHNPFYKIAKLRNPDTYLSTSNNTMSRSTSPLRLSPWAPLDL